MEKRNKIWLLVTILVIITLAVGVTTGCKGTFIESKELSKAVTDAYNQGKKDAAVETTVPEVTAEETTIVEETDKLTYEEFKKRYDELVKKADTMSPKEFQRALAELLVKLSDEDLIKVSQEIVDKIDETIESLSTETTSENKEIVGLEPAAIDWKTPWYQSPWRKTTDWLKDLLTRETVQEPGVLPGMDNTQTAWDKMGTKETFVLVPEAGYTYMANGGCSIYLIDPNDGTEILLGYFPPAKERIYLFIIRGLPADGGDLDLNRTILVKDYVPGTSINHVLRAGAYVSLGWFLQQIEASWEPVEGLQDPNAGTNGAENVYPTFLDVETQTTRAWIVIGPSVRDWKRVNDLS